MTFTWFIWSCLWNFILWCSLFLVDSQFKTELFVKSMVSDSLKFVHSLDLLMSSQSLLVRVIWWGKKRAKLSSPTFRQLCQFKTSWEYEKGGNLFSDLNINWQIALILIGCARVHKISDSCLIFRSSAFYLPKKIKKH